MTLLTIVARNGVSSIASRAFMRPSFASPMGSQLIASSQQQTQAGAQPQQQLIHHTQIRTITKRKKRLLAKKADKAALAEKGIFPPKPPNFMDKHIPVVNAQSREDRDAEAKRADQLASLELKERLTEQTAAPELMRHHMEGLEMSERVRMLFDLTNGSQSEVVKAQKQRGMELFQLRDGDTGSSAVQGTCLSRRVELMYEVLYVVKLFQVSPRAPLPHALTHTCLFLSIPVIALTTRIQQMQTHMRTHKKDKSSKRGLDAMFVRRRKLLDYMERKEFDSYRRVVKTLGLVR
jgi:small subunit ribosomal protein S15